VYCASVTRQCTVDGVETYLFHDCDRRRVLPGNKCCCKQTRATFQLSPVTGVRPWAVITPQTLQWQIGDRSRWL